MGQITYKGELMNGIPSGYGSKYNSNGIIIYKG